MKQYIIVVFLLMAGLHSHAQTGNITISGIIRDGKSNDFIPYANVVFKKANDSVFVTGTLSDEEGRFTLKDIAPGSYLLEVKYLGYLSMSQVVNIGSLSQ